MIYKIVFNNEIHRVRSEIKSFTALKDMITSRFAGKIPTVYFIEYKDSDADLVRINCEEDFAIFLEDSEDLKSIKLYIKDDPFATVQTVQSNLLKELEDEEEVPKVEKTLSVESEEPVVLEELKVEEDVQESPKLEEELQVSPKLEEEVPVSPKLEKEVPTEKKDSPQYSPVLDKLSLQNWTKPLDEAVVADNPIATLRRLMKEIQFRVRELKLSLPVKERRRAFGKGDFYKFKQEAKKLMKELQNNPLPTEINFDSIKDRLSELKGVTSPQEWMKFKLFVKSKVHETEQVLRSLPERAKKFESDVSAKKEERRKFRISKREERMRLNKQRQMELKQEKEDKFNKKIDESLRNAIPQIAVHVAQILQANNVQVDATAAERYTQVQAQEEAEINIEAPNVQEVVHQGYVCDGCGVSPIRGVCYKCSVCKNFDFCAKCESTKPHPHPFLKLKTPAQRPNMLFTVLNGEGEQNNLSQLFQQGMQQLAPLFKGCRMRCKRRRNQCPRFNEAPVQKPQDQEVTITTEEPKEESVFDEVPVQVVATDFVTLANCAQLMEVFTIPEDQKENVMVFLKKHETVKELLDLTNLWLDEAPKFEQPNVTEGLVSNEPVITEQPTEEVKPEEPKLEEPKPEPVVEVNPVDFVTLANCTQLMDIFSIPESKKDVLMTFLNSKESKDIQELTNNFLNEMIGKF